MMEHARSLRAALSFCLLLSAVTSSATEYFVDPNGNDYVAGSREFPWKTVGRVNSADLRAGDVVHFRAGGVWNEVLSAKSGAEGNPIIYTFSGEGAKPRLAGFQAVRQSHVKVEGLELYSRNATNAALIYESTDVTISGCTLYSSYTYWAPVISIQSNSRFNRILNNTAGSVEANNDVINLRGNADYNLIEGNTITAAGVHCALSVEGRTGGGTANYNVIRNNTLIGTKKAGSLIALQSDSNYSLVENNILTGDGTLGTYCGMNEFARHEGMFKVVTRDNIVRNNVVKDYPCRDTHGISLEAYTNGAWTNVSSGNHVYDNVITNLGPGGSTLFVGENGSGFTTNNVFKNNLVFNNGGIYYQTNIDGAYPSYTLWAQMGVQVSTRNAVTNNFFLNNLFHSPATSSVMWVGGAMRTVDGARDFAPDLYRDNVSGAPVLDSSYRPAPGSPSFEKGAFLTYATGAGSGTSLVVQDAGYFSDGNKLIPGDLIRVGSAQARVLKADRATNTLTLDTPVSWAAGAPVSMPYSGTRPHIGLHQIPVIPEPGPTPSVTPSPTPTQTPTPTASPIASGFTINATASSGGTITPAGDTLVRSGESRSYTITPSGGYYTASVAVDGRVVASNLGATSYTFSNVTGNHTIAANFLHVDVTITASAGANGTISPAGATQVTYGTSRTYVITPAPGYVVSSVVVDGVSKGAITSYAFTNVTANHTISATFRAPGYQIVASAGVGGTISPAGTVDVNAGALQAFTVNPTLGYYTAQVLVDGRVVAANLGGYTYTFPNLSANHTISAVFGVATFAITASAGAGGTITSSGSTIATYGSSRTFTITPSPGYAVASVLVDGVSQGAIRTYTFSNISANHTIAASFRLLGYQIYSSSSAGGTISPAGATLVSMGGSRTYAIAPARGYYTASVVVDGREVARNLGNYSYTFTNVTANHAISVKFGVATFNITASAGTGGSITPAGTATVPYGSSRTYVITPNAGYSVSSVLLDGRELGRVYSVPLSSISANHTIQVTFRPGPFQIYASASSGGTISPLGTTRVKTGGGVTYWIMPNPNFYTAALVIDGYKLVTPDVIVSWGLAQGQSNYTFGDVVSDHTISAIFLPVDIIVNATAGTGGTVSPSGWTPIPYGSSKTFTISPAVGYAISAVYVDGVSVGPVSSYTFRNVTTRHNLSAYFVRR